MTAFIKKFSLPNLRDYLPEVEFPELSLPEFSLPDLNIPEFHWPEIALPAVQDFVPAFRQAPAQFIRSLPLKTLPLSSTEFDTPPRYFEPHKIGIHDQLFRHLHTDTELGGPQTIAPLAVAVGVSVFIHALVGVWGWIKHQESKSDEELVSDARRTLMLDLAQTELENIEADPNHHPELDLFLFETELIGKSSISAKEEAKLYNEFAEKLAYYNFSLKNISDPLEQLYFLSSRLYYDFFHHYEENHPNLKNFLEHGKGNCVAQTKLILAAFSRSGIQLPKGYGIGIQVFKKHVQPVLYHMNDSGEVLWSRNLVNGSKDEALRAAIYRPEIVLTGFLLKQDEDPPLSFEDLLVAAPPQWQSIEGFNAYDKGYIEAQPIAWPLSNVDFQDPNIENPEDVLLPPPDFGEPIETDTASKVRDSKHPYTAGLELRLFADHPDLIPSGENLNGVPIYLYRHSGIQWPYLQDVNLQAGTQDNPKDVLYFRSKNQLLIFQTLVTVEQQQNFLLTLVKAGLKRFQESDYFKALKKVLTNPPSALSQQSMVELQKSAEMLSAMKSEVFFKPGQIDSFTQEKVLAFLPEYQKLLEQLKEFGQRVQSDPQSLYLMLQAESTREKRIALLDWLANFDFQGIELGQKRPLETFDQWLLDPKKIGVSTDPSNQSKFVPPPPEWYFFDFEVMDFEPIPAQAKTMKPENLEPNLSAPSETRESVVAAKSPPSEIMLSPELMMDLILPHPSYAYRFNDTQRNILTNRWDETLSRAFLNSARSREDHLRFKELVVLFRIQAMAKRYPQMMADLENVLDAEKNSGDIDNPPIDIPLYLNPNDQAIRDRYHRLFLSMDWKSHIPKHLLPVIRDIEAKEGDDFF